MDIRPKTLFIDIDGVLLEHRGNLQLCTTSENRIALTSVLDKLDKWDRRGYRIILVSGRRECHREVTEKQLRNAGIIYDQLVLGLGGGQRILINDLKPNDETPTAVAINLKRDEGIGNIEL